MTTQNEPIEDGQDNATDTDKVAGIIEQMRGDISQGNVTDVRDALTQRLSDAGLTVSDAELDNLLAQLS